VNLRPIKDRILIKPTLPPTVTESGIILAEERKPEQTGTVVAVGPCAHPHREDVIALADELITVAGISERSDNLIVDASEWLKQLVDTEPAVKVDDYVVFSYVAGQEIWVNDGQERYLLMRESDILCVVEGLEA